MRQRRRGAAGAGTWKVSSAKKAWLDTSLQICARPPRRGQARPVQAIERWREARKALASVTCQGT